MKHDPWFDSEENRTLTAICARRLIRNTGIGGIVWGAINIVFGIIAIQDTVINAGILILGGIMLWAGVQALRTPSLRVLLTETIVTVLMLVWNIGIGILNLLALGVFDPRGIIFPLIIVFFFAGYYRKLGHLRELIATVPPEKIETTKQICKTLLKKKLKNEPLIGQTSDRKCRVMLMDDKAFFIQGDLMRAFTATREAVRGAVAKPEAGKWTAVFNHPLGRLKYRFDKGNTEKLRNWLSGMRAPGADAAASQT